MMGNHDNDIRLMFPIPQKSAPVVFQFPTNLSQSFSSDATVNIQPESMQRVHLISMRKPSSAINNNNISVSTLKTTVV